MELVVLLALCLVLLSGSVAVGVYSRTEHGFFTLREARRQVRRLGYRRRSRWQLE
jgi:hypothetical protein